MDPRIQAANELATEMVVVLSSFCFGSIFDKEEWNESIEGFRSMAPGFAEAFLSISATSPKHYPLQQREIAQRALRVAVMQEKCNQQLVRYEDLESKTVDSVLEVLGTIDAMLEELQFFRDAVAKYGESVPLN